MTKISARPIEKEEEDFGQVFFAWQVPEYRELERTTKWYLAMIAIAGILLLYSIWTQNFLFALIIILVVFIVFLKTYSAPRMLDFMITEDGIMLGNQFFRYSNINSFYIIYKPPIKKIFFDLKSIAPDLSISLNDMNPIIIREKLREYLKEDLEREYQSLDDQLESLLRL